MALGSAPSWLRQNCPHQRKIELNTQTIISETLLSVSILYYVKYHYLLCDEHEIFITFIKNFTIACLVQSTEQKSVQKNKTTHSDIYCLGL